MFPVYGFLFHPTKITSWGKNVQEYGVKTIKSVEMKILPVMFEVVSAISSCGLSMGKDSLALVELLARRARIYKPRFSVVAVHVVMKNMFSALSKAVSRYLVSPT